MADEKKMRRIPKRIDGRKIPKDVRRAAEALVDAVLGHAHDRDDRPDKAVEMLGAVFGAMVEATIREALAAGPIMPPERAPRTPPRRPPPPAPDGGSPEPATPPRPPFPPMPPAGAAKVPGEERPDWDRVADELGRGAELVLGRLLGGRRR